MTKVNDQEVDPRGMTGGGGEEIVGETGPVERPLPGLATGRGMRDGRPTSAHDPWGVPHKVPPAENLAHANCVDRYRAAASDSGSVIGRENHTTAP